MKQFYKIVIEVEGFCADLFYCSVVTYFRVIYANVVLLREKKVITRVFLLID